MIALASAGPRHRVGIPPPEIAWALGAENRDLWRRYVMANARVWVLDDVGYGTPGTKAVYVSVEAAKAEHPDWRWELLGPDNWQAQTLDGDVFALTPFEVQG